MYTEADTQEYVCMYVCMYVCVKNRLVLTYESLQFIIYL